MLITVTKNILMFILVVPLIYAQVDQWEPVNNGLEDLRISKMEIDSESTIFTVTVTNKIFRSVDNGENWTDVTNGVNLSSITEIVATPDGTLFVASDYGLDEDFPTLIYRSTDHGDTWMSVDDGLPENMSLYCLRVAPDGIPYLSGETNGMPPEIYSFSVITRQWEPFDVPYVGRIVEMEFHGSDDIYFGEGINLAGNGVRVSKDGGHTFHRLGDFPHLGSDVSAIHVDPDGYLYVASQGFYPYRLDWDWVELSNGLPDGWPEEPSSSGFTVVSIESRPDPFGDMFIATDRYGVFRTVRHGAIWEDVNRVLTNLNLTELVCDSEGTLFAATDGGGVFRSTRTVPVELSAFTIE